MTIGVDPVAFNVGSMEIRWYGIIIALCIITMLVWTWHFGKKAGISADVLVGAGISAVIFGVVFSKLLHVIDKLGYYLDNPANILDRGGLTVFGAIIGGILGAWLYCRLRKMPFGPLADAGAPGVALGQVVGRMACTVNGCCHGYPTTLPWAYTYTQPASEARPLYVPLHPTQGYEMLANAVFFVILFWLLRGHLRPSGSLMAAYLVMYASGTAVIRVFRGDTEPFVGPLQEAQLASVIVVIICAWILIARKTRWVAKPEMAYEA